MVSTTLESSPRSKSIRVSSDGIILRSFFGRNAPTPIGRRQSYFTLDSESSIGLHCLMPSSSKLLTHGEAISPNQSLQPTALWRCASMSILISVSSAVAQPRSQSGG